MGEPSEEERRSQEAIARRLSEAGFALPGSLVERTTRCGKPNCRCKAEPPRLHGPYHQWTRKIDGKTATVNLTDEQLERYRPWLAEAQRLRALLNQLEMLTLRIAGRDESWSRKSR
jgi:hypothetical protein